MRAASTKNVNMDYIVQLYKTPLQKLSDGEVAILSWFLNNDPDPLARIDAHVAEAQ